MLSHSITSTIFFMGAHGLSLWEFSALEPSSHSDKRTTPPLSGSHQHSLLRISYAIASVLLAAWTVNNDRFFQLAICGMSGILVVCEKRHWAVGLLVVTLPFRVWLQVAPHDFPSTISVLLVVWNCDTGALVVGRVTQTLGFSRLPVPQWIHRISPAKSVEGFVGGMVGGTWTAVSWVPLLIRTASLDTTRDFDQLWETRQSRLLLGVSLSFLAIVGDLFESAIKRQSQSKDSGSILPGHGGVLDRFDSSLLAIMLYHCLLH
jgi:CDP-diglyceride synthetase